jgi:hypothetical protein
MLKSIRVPTILVRTGSVVLVITAFLYLYLGYPYMVKGMFAANLDGVVSGEVKAVWLGFCLHLFFVAYLLVVNSRRDHLHKSTVVMCGIIVSVDAFLVRGFVANTFAAQLLILSGMLILVGSCIWFFFKPTPDPAHV